MQQRQVGRSGLRVSRIGLGTMTWASQVDRYTATELLDGFLDAGGTLLDVAPVYGDGAAERLVGEVLAERGVRERIVLAGKCGVGIGEEGAAVDASRRTILRQLDQSLRDLGTDYLDLWQVHRWDGNVPLDETIDALNYAVSSGRVRYVGISNFTAWQSTLIHERLAGTHCGNGRAVTSTQVEYSLLRRSPERELINALEYLGIGLLAWSPLGRGVLTGKYRHGIPADSRGADDGWARWLTDYLQSPYTGVTEAVARASEGLGHTPAQIALAWVCGRPAVASAIVGPRTIDQLTELLQSDKIDMPTEITTALDDVSQALIRP